MRRARQHQLWVKRVVKLGSWQLDVRLARHGRCTAEECGYHNNWCPNGCPEHFDLDDPEPIETQLSAEDLTVIALDSDPAEDARAEQ